VPDMFTKSRPAPRSHISVDNSGVCSRVSVAVLPDEAVPKTSAEKYRHSMNLARQLCSVMADCGQREYGQRYALLRDVVKIWAEGKEAILSTVDSPVSTTTVGKSKLCLIIFYLI